MENNIGKNLWEKLWDYDPNGLLVLDKEFTIRTVNLAFCQMFGVEAGSVIGRPAEDLIDDIEVFHIAWESPEQIPSRERYYKKQDLFVRKVFFTLPEEELLACIMVDLTAEKQQRDEIQRIKRETIEKLNEVVDNQMKTAQEIASLLGEATAETKVSLVRLIEMVKEDLV